MKKNSFVITAVVYGAVAALAHAQSPGSATAAALPSAAAPVAMPTKIAVINFSEAIGRTKEGQKAAADLSRKFGPKKQDYDNRQKEIDQATDKLNKGRATMNEDAQRALQADIQKKTTDLKRFGEDSQAEMDTDEAKMINEFQQKMSPIVANYAIQNGFAVVMDIGNQSPVLWYASATNITDVIVALYDQAHPVIAESAPAPAPAPAPAKPPAKK